MQKKRKFNTRKYPLKFKLGFEFVSCQIHDLKKHTIFLGKEKNRFFPEKQKKTTKKQKNNFSGKKNRQKKIRQKNKVFNKKPHFFKS